MHQLHSIIRRTVCSALLSDGFKACGEAKDGQEALDLAARLLPDLIILDFSMRVMNGLRAAPLLRNLAPNSPIIPLSSDHDPVGATATMIGQVDAGKTLNAIPTGHLVPSHLILCSPRFVLRSSRGLPRSSVHPRPPVIPFPPMTSGAFSFATELLRQK